MNDYGHVSVLLNECIENLNIKPGGIYVDGTLGMGGHSFQIVSRLEGGTLYCIDRDISAIQRARERLIPFAGKVRFLHGNFCDMRSMLLEKGVEKVDGILLDLGVSSPQLDESDRGFSYLLEAPLDMRMNRDEGITAYDIVNTADENTLNRILWDYGEEKYARRITRAILNARSVKPIETTTQLSDIIRSAMPAPALREKQHPAKRTFQAIRIAVNNELESISKVMDDVPGLLATGGRICVISFHSLEDRIIKNSIARFENGCTCPREAPVCTCGFEKTLKSVTRKPIIPSETELEENPRSRSAKLRVAERV